MNELNDFLVPLGWAYVAVSLLSLLGLFPRIAPRIYPQRPSVLVRAVAPLLFAFLAIACFAHLGMNALILVVVAGTFQIGVHHYRNDKNDKSHKQRISH